mmetsp:Transcript_36143/g.44077  ORF Transcript_36143/g.44077 Transcript_36143/m.44077 type:complete len:299 (+) Transcript_36143:54-950(+)
MSVRLKRRYSLRSSTKLPIVPTVNTALTGDAAFHPSQAQRQAPGNKIKSTHYTPLTFVPIVLLLQFKNVVVCFYTFNTIMQFIPAISTNSPLASMIPTIFIILVGMGKELYLEIKRWREDKRINSLPCTTVTGCAAEGAEINCSEGEVQNLRVGDILRLDDDDYVPADCVLLQASQENGQAFTMTDALDGERNFKSKLVLPRCQKDIQQLLFARSLRLSVPEPNPDIYDFKGSIQYSFTGSDEGEEFDNEDMTNLQFVPRGSTIKFSGQLYAMVVYTGLETKLMQNLGSYTFKRSRMQ